MNMVCTNCGYEVAEETKIRECPECGTKLIGGVYTGSITACKVVLIVSFVAAVFPSSAAFFIPFAWIIPMTIYIWRRLDDGRRISTGMKVAVFFFYSVLLCIVLSACIEWHDVDEGRKIIEAESE